MNTIGQQIKKPFLAKPFFKRQVEVEINDEMTQAEAMEWFEENAKSCETCGEEIFDFCPSCS